MKLACLLLGAVAYAQAAASDFPSFDIFHSHCAINVLIPGKLCTNVYQSVINTIDSFNAGKDHSHGVYTYKEIQRISYVWVVHDSKRGWDSDVIFEPTQIGNDCQIRGRSRTKSTFHSAGTENYCDIWNVYMNIGAGSNKMDVSSCSSIPKDPTTTCSQ